MPPAGFVPASTLTRKAPYQYWSTSLTPSPEPPQRQAAIGDRRVAAHGTRAALRVVELGADRARGELLRVALAGPQHAAALVHVRARLVGEVEREPRRGAAGPADAARHDVVAGLPDDGVVVAEHAERVGRLAAVRVDVVDVGGDAVGGERVDVRLRRTSARSRRPARATRPCSPRPRSRARGCRSPTRRGR